MNPPPITGNVWRRPRSRREVLRIGAGFVAAGGLASLVSACLSPSGRATSSAGAGSSEAITVLVGAGSDPAVVPSMQAVYDEFAAQRAGVEWDIRLLQGGGPEWDRAARATLSSGEPVGFIAINGQQVRGFVRDGLLADLGADPELSTFLGRVPEQFHLTGPGEDAVRAVPLALTGGVHTTGLYYNRALLDRAEIDVPRTWADLQAAVAPLAALDVAPLVHCSGDVFFNEMLVTWVLPMVVGRGGGDPIEFAERTVAGEIGYDSPEWIEALQIIADLRRSGILMEGSAAVDYATMQQLLLQGRVAMTYQGSWMLPQIQAGSPSGEFDLHVASPPTIDGADRSRPILAWAGIGIPAASSPTSDTIRAFLEYASQPEVDRAVVEGLQAFSPIAESNAAISDELAREFLPMFDDAITPLDWLWEPEITAELDSQVQGLVRGDVEPAAAAAAVAVVADELRASGRSYVP